MTKGDDARGAAVLAGLMLWFAYPFVFVAGNTALHKHRCAGRIYQGEWDDCFSDGLPFDLIAFPMTLILLYPFAKFAFVAFAPKPEDRSRFWRLAASEAGIAYYPVVQALAGLGALWALLHVRSFPLEKGFFLYFAYWAA